MNHLPSIQSGPKGHYNLTLDEVPCFKANIMKHIILLFTLSVAWSAMAQTIEGTSNSVLVEVKKSRGVEEGKEEKLTLATLGITNVPTYHALIIGVSEYKNAGAGLPALDMPVKDAERLYQTLTTKYTFDPANVTLLKNPTRADIIDQLDLLTKKVKERDNLLIFYAGHGVYEKATDFGFWLPSDAKKESRSAWIANSQIKDYIGAIKSKHTLLITDACFSGSIFKTRSVDTELRRFYDIYKDTSRKGLTSGNLTEVPDKSVFVKYLLQRLEENQDVFLSSTVLFSRMYEPIINNAATTPQFGVIQGAGDEGGDFVFIKRD